MTRAILAVRSVAGIVAGLVVVAMLGAMARAVVFHGPVPGAIPLPLALLLLLMYGLAAIAGGYVGAAAAGRRPVAHGFAVGVGYLVAVQLAPSLAARLNPGVGIQPLWLTGAAMGMALLGAILGGSARAQRTRAPAG